MLMDKWRGNIRTRRSGFECFKGQVRLAVHWVGVKAVERKYQLLYYIILDEWLHCML